MAAVQAGLRLAGYAARRARVAGQTDVLRGPTDEKRMRLLW